MILICYLQKRAQFENLKLYSPPQKSRPDLYIHLIIIQIFKLIYKQKMSSEMTGALSLNFLFKLFQTIQPPELSGEFLHAYDGRLHRG